MATFTTQPFHELLDSDKTTPSTVLDSDGKLKQSLHNLIPNTDISDPDTGFVEVGATLVQSGTSPSGKPAYLITENTNTNVQHRIYKAPAVVSGRYYGISVDVKRGTGSRNVTIYLGSAGFGSSVRWNLDLDTGDVTSQVNGTKDAAIATELADGWWNFTVYAEATANSYPAFSIALADGTDIQYNGDGTSSIYVSRPRLYEASVHVPVERFENTDFATDTDWGKTNWTIGSGVASKTVGTFGGISQAVDLVEGEKYRIEVTVSNYVAGILTARLASGGGLGAGIVTSEDITANGTYVFILTALSSSTYAGFAGSDTFDGDIDNVSLTKVITDGIQNDLDGEDFIETSGSAIYHGGLEYNGDGSFRGIQSFEGRTNLQTRPHPQDGVSSWTNDNNMDVTYGHSDLFGDRNAAKLIPTTTSGSHYRGHNISIGSTATHTMSCFVKADGIDWVALWFGGGDQAVQDRATFNLSTGAVGTSEQGSPDAKRIEDYGDGWYRISMTATVNASGSFAPIVMALDSDNVSASFAGDGTDGFYLVGTQVEQASSPSPYIPTTGSTRSRGVDKLHKPLSEFGYNHNELTVKVEFESAGTDGGDYPHAFQIGGIDNTGNTERHDLLYDKFSGELIAVNRTNNTTNSYLQLGTGPTNQLVKVMAAFKKDDYAASDNGDTVVTDTTGDMPTVDTLFLGNQRIADALLNGYIKKLIIWPKRLADATLEAESE